MSEKMIFKAIVGSQSYGTATPTSDIDYKGVYIQDKNDILGLKYKPQYKVGKDESYYEVKRYLELLASANPTVLELLYSPTDCVEIWDVRFNKIQSQASKFLTKKCRNSFGGYAVQQIQKAKGLNKKMNYEKEKMERKDVLDFCFVILGEHAIPLKNWLAIHGYKQENMGLTKINHVKDGYAMFGERKSIRYKGLVADDSNELRLSSIPASETPIAQIHWNKDGYTVHCKDYNAYQVWLKERNEQRFIDVKGHDQKIDGKNMLHCRRLLDTALEIAQEGTIHVRRPNAAYLLQIRRGEVNLEKLIAEAEEDLLKLDEVYAKCSLPDDVDPEFLHNLLVEIRTL